MDPDKLKIGDFLTWTWEDNPGITVGRIISLEKYKVSKTDKLYGKVCGAQMLVFPHWDADSYHSREILARVSRYYLEQSGYASEAEVTAWLKCAMEYEDNLLKEVDAVRKCYNRPIDQSKVVHMDNINKYDYHRLPPTHCVNWLWSCLQRFKLYNPKKGTVLLWGTNLWKPQPKTTTKL